MAPTSAWRVGGGGHRHVAALAVGSTSRPAARACAQVASSASQPANPRRSKQASCGLTATQAGPAASISARQWRARRRRPCADAGWRARRGGAGARGRWRRRARRRAPRAGRRRPAARPATAGRGRDRSRGRSATRGRRPPRRDGRRKRGRRLERSPAPGTAPARLLDGLLEARAGGEARHLARRDRHRLARAGVAPSRAPRSATWNLPKPVNVTSSPDFSASSIERSTASTASPASFLLRPSLTRPGRRILPSSWLLLLPVAGSLNPALFRGVRTFERS